MGSSYPLGEPCALRGRCQPPAVPGGSEPRADPAPSSLWPCCHTGPESTGPRGHAPAITHRTRKVISEVGRSLAHRPPRHSRSAHSQSSCANREATAAVVPAAGRMWGGRAWKSVGCRRHCARTHGRPVSHRSWECIVPRVPQGLCPGDMGALQDLDTIQKQMGLSGRQPCPLGGPQPVLHAKSICRHRTRPLALKQLGGLGG